MSIQVESLTKIFGQQKAVDQITFSVSPGEIAGFLGPNGAGKSTTMKILTGILPPSSGTVRVDGVDVTETAAEVKARIGYLPEHNPLYLDLYVHEYLSFMAGLYGISGRRKKERIAEMIGLCGLGQEQNKKIGTLSKGYRQRVGLAQAMIQDPKILILDEPTSGLDPNQLVEIRKLIRTVSKDKTVLFSTHILQEVQALCDRVIVINKGHIAADDSLSNLIHLGSNQVIVEFTNAVEESLLKQLSGLTAVQRLEGNRFRVTGNHDLRPDLVQFAAHHNLSLIEIKQDERSLETIFSQLTNPESTT